MTALSAVIIAYATLSASAGGTSTNADEVVHFLLFFPLGVGGALWTATLAPDRQRRAQVIVLVVILAFAAATEIGQMFVETRHASITDFIADAAGAGLGVLVGSMIAGRARDEA